MKKNAICISALLLLQPLVAGAISRSDAVSRSAWMIGRHQVLASCALLLFIVICCLAFVLRTSLLLYARKYKLKAGLLFSVLLLLAQLPANAQVAADESLLLLPGITDEDLVTYIWYVVLVLESGIIISFSRCILLLNRSLHKPSAGL